MTDNHRILTRKRGFHDTSIQTKAESPTRNTSQHNRMRKSMRLQLTQLIGKESIATSKIKQPSQSNLKEQDGIFWGNSRRHKTHPPLNESQEVELENNDDIWYNENDIPPFTIDENQLNPDGTPITYCICKTPYDSRRFMIGCDSCDGWFHARCVNITVQEAQSLKVFICPNCKTKTSSSTNPIKHNNIYTKSKKKFNKVQEILGDSEYFTSIQDGESDNDEPIYDSSEEEQTLDEIYQSHNHYPEETKHKKVKEVKENQIEDKTSKQLPMNENNDISSQPIQLNTDTQLPSINAILPEQENKTNQNSKTIIFSNRDHLDDVINSPSLEHFESLLDNTLPNDVDDSKYDPQENDKNRLENIMEIQSALFMKLRRIELEQRVLATGINYAARLSWIKECRDKCQDNITRSNQNQSSEPQPIYPKHIDNRKINTNTKSKLDNIYKKNDSPLLTIRSFECIFCPSCQCSIIYTKFIQHLDECIKSKKNTYNPYIPIIINDINPLNDNSGTSNDKEKTLNRFKKIYNTEIPSRLQYCGYPYLNSEFNTNKLEISINRFCSRLRTDCKEHILWDIEWKTSIEDRQHQLILKVDICTREYEGIQSNIVARDERKMTDEEMELLAIEMEKKQDIKNESKNETNTPKTIERIEEQDKECIEDII